MSDKGYTSTVLLDTLRELSAAFGEAAFAFEDARISAGRLNLALLEGMSWRERFIAWATRPFRRLLS